MAPQNPNEQQAQVTITWDDILDHPVMAANAFLIQQTEHEVVLSIGFATLPYSKRPEDATKVTEVPAKIISRLSLPE